MNEEDQSQAKGKTRWDTAQIQTAPKRIKTHKRPGLQELKILRLHFIPIRLASNKNKNNVNT